MPERTATTVSFFFICHDAAPSLVCNFFALFARLAILHPSFLFSGVFLWGRKKMEPRIQFQYRCNAESRCLQADEPLVCKQTKRSSANVPKEQKRKYAMCVSASSALRERLSNTHLSKTTQREEKNKKRRKRKHQARGNEVTVCHNLFERQDQVSRCRPETTMAAL